MDNVFRLHVIRKGRVYPAQMFYVEKLYVFNINIRKELLKGFKEYQQYTPK